MMAAATVVMLVACLLYKRRTQQWQIEIKQERRELYSGELSSW